MRRFVKWALLLVSLVLVIVAVVLYRQYSPSRALTALTLNVYWEAAVAKEPEIGMRMVAYATRQRALQGHAYWGGSDIYNVVYARHTKRNGKSVCQFTWTCLDVKNQEPQSKEKLNASSKIASDELSGRFTPPPGFEGATSYLNPEVSGRRNICEFKSKLVRLGKVDPQSKHVFYREPVSAAERASLPDKKDIPECKIQARKKFRA